MNIMEQWHQIAVEIGNDIFRLVNSDETVGTDDETGYILMFFNARNHDGKATLVASEISKPELKKILKTTLRALDDGKKTRIVPPAGHPN